MKKPSQSKLCAKSYKNLKQMVWTHETDEIWKIENTHERENCCHSSPNLQSSAVEPVSDTWQHFAREMHSAYLLTRINTLGFGSNRNQNAHVNRTASGTTKLTRDRSGDPQSNLTISPLPVRHVWLPKNLKGKFASLGFDVRHCSRDARADRLCSLRVGELACACRHVEPPILTPFSPVCLFFIPIKILTLLLSELGPIKEFS